MILVLGRRKEGSFQLNRELQDSLGYKRSCLKKKKKQKKRKENERRKRGKEKPKETKKEKRNRRESTKAEPAATTACEH